MIWDSVPLMTAIDLLIMGVVAYSLWRCRRISLENRFERSRIARLLINSGLLILGLFYTADLAVMHVLPMVASMDKANEVMRTLHREFSWLVNLFAVIFISIGFIELITELQREETQRKQVESEARESERRYHEVEMELAHANRVATMGQLTASIAHEVNQPITATVISAKAALRWLTHEPPNLEESRQLLGRIAKDGLRASNVVGRIRELTKKAPPRMQRMEINSAIGEVIELTHSEAIKSGISVQTQLAEGLPLVEADRVQLQQVTLNLIVNAIQALSESAKDPRELVISTSMNGSNDVTVCVRDSGPGLSPESLGRLFEPFYTTKPDGMGIGLSVCESIIESHRGRIWATTNVPQGAAFYFTIPTAPQETLGRIQAS